MVRTVVASESFLAYLSSIGTVGLYNVGLILGQHTPTKDFVIHIAKTPPFQGHQKKSIVASFKLISEIPITWVADHAKHTTRLLPGGMHILGIFVVSKDDPFTEQAKLTILCSEIYSTLRANPFIHGTPPTSELLVLHYSLNSNSATCKCVDVATGIVKAADINFVSTKTEWITLECFYELGQVFPIPDTEVDLSLKKHMTKVLQSISTSLQSAVFLFDGEIKNEDYSFDQQKKKKSLHHTEHIRSVQVSILLPSDCSDLTQPVEVRNCGGSIKLSGQIASKIWVNSKMTVADISRAIVEDIIRSLAARLEMHFDSLIEEEHGSPEDTNSIHEPPRRVLIKLPGSEITLSDYLFPGEGPQDAKISLEELLDITVYEKDGIQDVEGQADLSEFYSNQLDVESEDSLPKLPTETSKFMYMIGLGIAFFVLILSLLIHFLQNL